jgi:hypothetical protein
MATNSLLQQQQSPEEDPSMDDTAPKNKRKLKKVGDKGIAADIQIAAGMACIALLSQEGLQAIQQVLQGAKDPVQALAHVIFMAIAKVRTTLQEKGIKIDDRVWIMGGGVLDRVMFEVMIALATALKYPAASNSQFVHGVKEGVLDLMQDADDNDESIRVLHDKGLPVPKGPPSDSQQQQQPPQQQQGLIAPQQGQQTMMGGQ